MKFLIFRAIIVFSFGLIALQLFNIQINSGDLYSRLAEKNRFRLIADEAPRGIVYDRNGAILVRNTPNYVIAILPADLPDDKFERTVIYTRLAQILHLPVTTQGNGKDTLGPGLQSPVLGPGDKGITELVDDARFNPFNYVRLKSNVAPAVAESIEEMRVDLPGVYVLREPTRQYVFKENLAHLLGYTGGIPEDKLAQYQDQGYEIDDKIGVAGVERVFESDLRGGKGERLVEVDASGREIRTLAAQPAAPGKNLVLTIDADLQNAATEALKAGLKKINARAGVVLAMDPNNGQMLAMVSYPSYDDNLFANGISGDDYAALLNNKDLPLFNRALSGEYPLGSVFKIVPASAALQEGVVGLNTTVLDSGVMWVPNKFYPNEPRLAQPFYGWARQGLGLMNITSALAWSSDIYFYTVAGGFENFKGLGLTRLVSYTQAFGFGDPTGINLPGEAGGLVPTDRWKRLNYAQPWVTGDTYNMGIGQGFLLATPMQLLNATSAVVNGGALYKPQIARALIDSEGHILKQFDPELIRQVPVSAQNLAVVRNGLRAAVTSGTAQTINLAGLKVAGKTGTAEYPGPRDKQGRLPTHAWFTAYAPYDNPQIVLVIFVENGGEGSETAVPIAASILKDYFHLGQNASVLPNSGTAPSQTRVSESPQAGAVPPRTSTVPKKLKVRTLAQETGSSAYASISGWVRDRGGRPVPGVTVAIDRGGELVVRSLTGADGSFHYDTIPYEIGRDWHVRVEGSDSEILSLRPQPATKYTVLFYEE